MENSTIVPQFLNGLRKKLSEDYNELLSCATGATEGQIKELKKRFPECPDSLIQLLQQINGTYHETYGEQKVSLCILGSDVFELSYFLLSVQQILEHKGFVRTIRQIWGAYPDMFPAMAGKGINPDVEISRWLCFSKCMNNGGSSSLYIDFNPGPEGKAGQVIRFLHDPDSFKVIADNFDEYLQMLIDKDYDYLSDEDKDYI